MRFSSAEGCSTYVKAFLRIFGVIARGFLGLPVHAAIGGRRSACLNTCTVQSRCLVSCTVATQSAVYGSIIAIQSRRALRLALALILAPSPKYKGNAVRFRLAILRGLRLASRANGVTRSRGTDKRPRISVCTRLTRRDSKIRKSSARFRPDSAQAHSHRQITGDVTSPEKNHVAAAVQPYCAEQLSASWAPSCDGLSLGEYYSSCHVAELTF